MRDAIKPTAAEAESILTICLLAAFADGAKSDTEREAIRGVAESLPQREKHNPALFKRVLLGQVSCAQAAQPLRRRELRQLAYEMAVCVCEADHFLTQPEKTFLQQLQQILELDSDFTAAIERRAEVVACAEIDDPAPAVSIDQNGGNGEAFRDASKSDRIILKCAILTSALELMPQPLATMAIIPLQMKMVYRIGKKHGYELDRSHIKELLAAAGLGLSSQVLGGYISKLFDALLGKLGGKLPGSVGNEVTSSALSFAVTFAIGQMADRYHSSGRTTPSEELRWIFEQFKGQGADLYSRYAGEIRQRSQSIDVSEIANLIRLH